MMSLLSDEVYVVHRAEEKEEAEEDRLEEECRQLYFMSNPFVCSLSHFLFSLVWFCIQRQILTEVNNNFIHSFPLLLLSLVFLVYV